MLHPLDICELIALTGDSFHSLKMAASKPTADIFQRTIFQIAYN